MAALPLEIDEAAPRDRKPLMIAGAAGLALLACIALRAPIVHSLPGAGSLFAAVGLPVNVVGLEIGSVSARIVPDGDRKILLVEGEVVNVTQSSRSAPAMRVAVLAESGVQTYAWSTKAPRQTLAPGERAGFSARLASPPGDAASVAVEFEKSTGKTVAKGL